MSREHLKESTWKWIDDHVELYLRDPEKAHMWDSSLAGYTGKKIPTLLLTTKGRTTGKTIYSPLIYDKTGDSYFVIGSKGGAPDHPHWYKNILADPNVEVQVGAKHFFATARTATGPERSKLWAQLREVYPPYDDYQKRAGSREIPVIVFDPIPWTRRKAMGASPVPPNINEWISSHIKLYKTDPEAAHYWDFTLMGVPKKIQTLLLTTKGRKTGKTILSPLIYMKEGDTYVVVASKGGAPEHPHWYSNLVANPDVEIQVGAKHFRAKARTAPSEERAKLWAKLRHVYSPYDDYQARAGSREIPVVVFEPQT